MEYSFLFPVLCNDRLLSKSYYVCMCVYIPVYIYIYTLTKIHIYIKFRTNHKISFLRKWLTYLPPNLFAAQLTIFQDLY